MLSGGTDSNGLLTVNGGSNTLFNSATATNVRTLSGTAGMAGAISGTVTLTTSGKGLTGESPINVLVPYTAQVTSGNAIWTSTSSSSWGTHPNWTDSGSNTVHAAPGTFAGFTNTDTATFNGQDSVPTINVDTNVSLAGLNFSGSNYTLNGGTISLDSAGGTATVLAINGGTQTIASALVLSPTAVVSFQPDAASVIVVGGSNGTTISGMTSGSGTLSLDGPGELVLQQGTVNTLAATIVSQGTLDVQDGGALADGSSLTVGDASLFTPSVALGNHASSEALASHAGSSTVAAPGLAAVPEPGTLALVAGGAALLALLYRRRRRGKHKMSKLIKSGGEKWRKCPVFQGSAFISSLRSKTSVISSATVVLLLTAGGVAANENLKLWYNKPAATWEREALPIGNGHMGAMLFGGETTERIQFNEESLWIGNEDDSGAYQNFGDVTIHLDGPVVNTQGEKLPTRARSQSCRASRKL